MILSQIIMLYTLNLYRALFQLYLNKTERKKMEKKKDVKMWRQPGRALSYICVVQRRDRYNQLAVRLDCWKE